MMKGGFLSVLSKPGSYEVNESEARINMRIVFFLEGILSRFSERGTL
jgi:hypothetical protein